MNIYFSGIGGVGIGPLAEIAHDAGYQVQGSDMTESPIATKLQNRHIPISFHQDGTFLQERHDLSPIDWFVHTAALPLSHPELLRARQLGIKTAKRDELLALIIKEKKLKLIAVAGTHGKTTTTGMLAWTLQQLGVPISYSIGTTIGFGPSGKFDPASTYFIYECDEYDRNFLQFHPQVSLITSVGYDHPDTYPTESDYIQAFKQFIDQSDMVVMWNHDTADLGVSSDKAWLLRDDETLHLPLAGTHNRQNATLAAKTLEYLHIGSHDQVVAALSEFPGTDRRFERLAENLYTDYGHHPEEIAVTLQLARELSDHVVLVYQPHQNVRQHQVKDQYTTCFELAEKVYWLPTYLSREDPDLPILSAQELTTNITNKDIVESDLDEDLWMQVQDDLNAGKLVLFMGAGNIDNWVRQRLATGALPLQS